MVDERTYDLDQIKGEAKELACNLEKILIGGKEYKILVQTSNVLKHREVFKAADAYIGDAELEQETITIDGEEIAIEGSMKDAIDRYNLVIAILRLYNGQLDEREILDHCDNKTTLKVYNAWLGIA